MAASVQCPCSSVRLGQWSALPERGRPLGLIVLGHLTNKWQSSWAALGSLQRAVLFSSRPALASRGCFWHLSGAAYQINANSHTPFLPTKWKAP